MRPGGTRKVRIAVWSRPLGWGRAGPISPAAASLVPASLDRSGETDHAVVTKPGFCHTDAEDRLPAASRPRAPLSLAKMLSAIRDA